jgi:hypothetical protein
MGHVVVDIPREPEFRDAVVHSIRTRAVARAVIEESLRLIGISRALVASSRRARAARKVTSAAIRTLGSDSSSSGCGASAARVTHFMDRRRAGARTIADAQHAA